MSSVNQWLKEFQGLHEQFRKGKLSDKDKQAYHSAREQFARALVSAQGLALPPGQSARRTFRVAQGLQVDVSLASDTSRLMTLDVSCGGFSALMHKPPGPKEEPGFSLRLPGGVDAIVGRCRVVSSNRQIGNFRVSFAFIELPDKEMERLETALFDIALSRLG